MVRDLTHMGCCLKHGASVRDATRALPIVRHIRLCEHDLVIENNSLHRASPLEGYNAALDNKDFCIEDKMSTIRSISAYLLTRIASSEAFRRFASTRSCCT